MSFLNLLEKERRKEEWKLPWFVSRDEDLIYKYQSSKIISIESQ